MRQREVGACYAYTKSDGSCFAIPRSEFPRLLAEWMAGKAFWRGAGFYGTDMSIKLSDVVSISDASPESLAAGRADARADAEEDRAEQLFEP